jgi:hypothetical protein
LLKLFRHVVKRPIGIDNRKLEQSIGIYVGEQTWHDFSFADYRYDSNIQPVNPRPARRILIMHIYPKLGNRFLLSELLACAVLGLNYPK